LTCEPTSAIATAQEIAEKLLFPAALDVDAAEIVPSSHLDGIAGAGFYGAVTAQRPAVATVLASSKDHATAQEVCERLRERFRT
jgi:hypothetical protein